MTIDVTLPLPPSVNGSYFNAPGFGRAKSKKLLTWCRDTGWLLKQTYCGGLSGRWALVVEVPKKMRGDVDNRIKAVSDLLVSHGVVTDDKHAFFMGAVRSDRVPDGMCRVTVATSIQPIIAILQRGLRVGDAAQSRPGDCLPAGPVEAAA